MPWSYKPPQNFPAAYGAAIKAAVANPNEPYMLGGFYTKPEAEALAERIRWFKYCIRNSPGHELQTILENYDVRTVTKEDTSFLGTVDNMGFILWLVARPKLISDFILLNPKLAVEILSQL